MANILMLPHLIHALVFVGTLLCMQPARSQSVNRYSLDTIPTVALDTAATITTKAGLTVQDFIDELMHDTNFYEAFRKMSDYSFISDSRVITYDKKNKVNGYIDRKIRHSNYEGKQHHIELLAQQDTGKIYKRNGKYHLYTLSLFDYIFVNAYNSDFVREEHLIKSHRKNESYKNKLKTLIFSPGTPITGVPFVGKKTQIFSPAMRHFYQYEFAKGTYLDSIPVYRFSVAERPSLSDNEKEQTVIKVLTSIFDARNFQILGRYVAMNYASLLLSFNIQMRIELGYFDNQLLPVKISYQGNWDIPFKQEERSSFLITHTDYCRSPFTHK